MDSDKDGYITHSDLCRYLGVPSDACTQAVFSALTSRERLSFRDYLHGVVGKSLPLATDEALLEMFQVRPPYMDTHSHSLTHTHTLSLYI